MILVKLGGSIITDKGYSLPEPKAFKHEDTSRLAGEIKEAMDRGIKMVIVHGAGSFGHPLAKRYRLNEGFSNPDQLRGVAEVQRDMKRLNLLVLNGFIESGINAVSLPPSTFLTCSDRKAKSFDHSHFKGYLELGLTPITFGDVVLDEQLKFCICSGDLLMLELSKELKAEKAIFAADVDGIFDSDPAKNPEAKLLEEVGEKDISRFDGSQSLVDDVTGSMKGKLEVMLEISKSGAETMVLNGGVPGRLKKALTGENVTCTKIISDLR